MAATFIVKLGGLDLSQYCRMNPDDKLDPYSAHFVEPAFADTPFSDGQVLISTTVNNREQMFPMFLRDTTTLKDALHALIQSINNAAAVKPLVLEWRDAGASASTFYDVAFARFEPDFNFRRSTHGYGAGVLHVYTTGYGHTGTTRVTATAAGTGIFLSVPIASVAGDAPALLDTTIVSGAVVPSLGRIVALAPITNPSYAALIPAASLTDLQAGASLTGASGAQGSQYLALPVSPTGGASGIACKVPLPNPTIAGGDNRILAVVKAGIDAGVAINALDPYGNAMGATSVASMSQGWGLVDLGVCRLPTVGFPTLPKISILAGALWASGASGPLILASPAGLALNEILCLPDKNMTLLYERGVAGPGAFSKDSFAGGAALVGQNDSLGNPWTGGQNGKNAGQLLQEAGGLVYNNLAPTSAMTSDAARLANILTDSMTISAKPQFWGYASAGEVRLVKESASGVYVQARMRGDSAAGFLDISAATNTTLNLLASTSLTTIVSGAKYRFSLKLQGGAALLQLTKDDGGAVFPNNASSAFASLGASSAAVSGAGAPALAITNTPGQNSVAPYVYSWEVDPLPAASTLAPYDSYRIDGVNSDSYRVATSGVFAGAKLVSSQKGAFAKMVPSTVSLAVVCAPVDQGVANDIISAAVSVKERFSYGR